YIAMELLDGITLGDVLKDGALSQQRAVNIARAILAALAHAHSHDVLHRDVKPENIMLVTRDVPRTVLIDFGLAWLKDEPSLTANGTCMGSPAYIAPERLLGRAYDATTDLYAVGVILFEMLSGARPFAGANPEHTMQLALHEPPRALRELAPEVSPAL